MCRRTTCKSCGKPSFAGCGMHVEEVLAGVPTSQRCSCAADAKAARSAAAPAGSWFSQLFRRN